jgi:hypothetical protein
MKVGLGHLGGIEAAGADEGAGEAGLATAERAGERDHVALAGARGQGGGQAAGRGLVGQIDHQGKRAVHGIVLGAGAACRKDAAGLRESGGAVMFGRGRERMAERFKTDVAIIGAGPVGLFAVFECGMLKLSCQC